MEYELVQNGLLTENIVWMKRINFLKPTYVLFR